MSQTEIDWRHPLSFECHFSSVVLADFHNFFSATTRRWLHVMLSCLTLSCLPHAQIALEGNVTVERVNHSMLGTSYPCCTGSVTVDTEYESIGTECAVEAGSQMSNTSSELVLCMSRRGLVSRSTRRWPSGSASFGRCYCCSIWLRHQG